MEINKDEVKLTAHQIVEKHMQNKDHIITTEDISDITLSLKPETGEEAILNKELIKYKIDELNPNHPKHGSLSSYDILDI